MGKPYLLADLMKPSAVTWDSHRLQAKFIVRKAEVIPLVRLGWTSYPAWEGLWTAAIGRPSQQTRISTATRKNEKRYYMKTLYFRGNPKNLGPPPSLPTRLSHNTDILPSPTASYKSGYCKTQEMGLCSDYTLISRWQLVFTQTLSLLFVLWYCSLIHLDFFRGQFCLGQGGLTSQVSHSQALEGLDLTNLSRSAVPWQVSPTSRWLFFWDTCTYY